VLVIELVLAILIVIMLVIVMASADRRNLIQTAKSLRENEIYLKFRHRSNFVRIPRESNAKRRNILRRIRFSIEFAKLQRDLTISRNDQIAETSTMTVRRCPARDRVMRSAPRHLLDSADRVIPNTKNRGDF
jgi:hypothetical protein